MCISYFISINSSGQVQYTSTNVAGWSASTIRFTINQNSLTGNYSSLSQPTSGNTYIYDSINLTNTANAVSGSSVGSAYMAGGLTVAKNLIVNGQITRQVGMVSYNNGTTNITCPNITTTNLTPLFASTWITGGSLGTVGNYSGSTGIVYTGGNFVNSSGSTQSYIINYGISPSNISTGSCNFVLVTSSGRYFGGTTLSASNGWVGYNVNGYSAIQLNNNETVQLQAYPYSSAGLVIGNNSAYISFSVI